MLNFRKEIEKDPYHGPARIGFTFTYVSHQKCSILFGGCKDTDVFIFDHTKKQWITKITGGKKPTPRKNHAACFVRHLYSLLISGGQDESGRSLEDMYILSMKDWKWKKILLVKQPSARYMHSLLPITEMEVAIFGGISNSMNVNSNDVWVVIINKVDANKNQVFGSDCHQLKVKGAPEGRCLSESTIMLRDKIYTACQRSNRDSYTSQFYCLDIKRKVWKNLSLKFVCNQIKLFKIITPQREQTFIISLTDEQRNAGIQYFLFQEQKLSVSNISSKIQNQIDDCDQLYIDPNSECQLLCLSKGKKLNIYQFQLQQKMIKQSPLAIEEYLIAIKHEQLLSQQLLKKNIYLQQLYKQMQNYITILHKQYVKYEQDPVIENQKQMHIEDCRKLKAQYSKFDKLYDDVCFNIKSIRGQLGNINQDFQRCMETQFDEEAE